MATITITFEAEPDRIRRLLDAWDDRPLPPERANGEFGPGPELIDQFLTRLTPDGLRTAAVVVQRSASGDRVYRDELEAELKADAGEVNGYMGNIGRTWKAAFGEGVPNPFPARYDPGRKAQFHRLQPSLARAILERMDDRAG